MLHRDCLGARPATASLSRPALRVAGITINERVFNSTAHVDCVVAWRTLDLCVAAEQCVHALCGSDTIPDQALMMIDVEFPYEQFEDCSFIGPLASNYSTLARAVRVLKIAFNNHDESVFIGAFVALATRLHELNLSDCGGLASLRGLEGRCEYLQRVNLDGCCRLSSLEGLGNHQWLEMVNASYTAISSLAPLGTCPSLKQVIFRCCRQLTSLQGLEAHQRLKEVDVTATSIKTVEPLRSCPALTKVVLYGCLKFPYHAPSDFPSSVQFLRRD